jgi:Tfp pilus assembly protein PilN
MNEFEMIVMVVLILSLAAVTIAVIAARARSAGARAANPALDRELATLKERVAVLERIATDKNHRLEHEFERLREG